MFEVGIHLNFSMLARTFVFGQHTPQFSQIFFKSSLSYGFVNLKPVLPGHVLTIPIRKVERFRDLTVDELSDLMLSTQTIGKELEKYYNVDSLSIVIQDGKNSGQTVRHVHVHIIPRKKGDFEINDEIYDKLERVDVDSRKERTEEEMEKEALELSKLFPKYQ